MKRTILAAIGLLVAALIWAVLSIYPDWLWFENLHFSTVFWTSARLIVETSESPGFIRIGSGAISSAL